MIKEKIENVTDLERFVTNVFNTLKLKKNLNQATVLAFCGDLGAGKTTFVQFLAKQLGVDGVVNSPTFTIMKKYSLPNKTQWGCLVHMDVYRIDDVQELKPLGFNDLLVDGKNLICVEWAGKITEELPKDTIWLNFLVSEEGGREVVVDGLD
ncbi:MAG: tRNA (adenosine(37)-N6)-threonylcarbamoyltransferase complex ATPase subunit type 1 TsaE [Candidatus Paceibacterota bacterium]